MMIASEGPKRGRWTGDWAWTLATGALLIYAASVAGAKGKPGGGGNGPSYDLVWLGEMSLTNDINDLGQVVGKISGESVFISPEDDLDGTPDVWFRDVDADGTNDLAVSLGWLQREPPFAFRHSEANALNDLGQVVGWSTSDSLHTEGYPLYHGYLWRDIDGDRRSDPGEMIDLGVPAPGEETAATDINDDGVVIGFTVGANPRGFVLAPEDTDLDGIADRWFVDGGDGVNLLMVDLGPVSPLGMNEIGWIVGETGDGGAGSAGFVIVPEDVDGDDATEWFADTDLDGVNDLMVELPCPPTAESCSATAVNSLGQIVGSSLDGPSGRRTKRHAVLWEPDGTGGFVLNDLGTVKGEDATVAKDINDRGQIAGYGSSFSRNTGNLRYSYTAFYWENGSMTTFDDLVTSSDRLCPFDEHRASAINSPGQIVGGWFVTSQCAGGGFVAVPSTGRP